MTNHTARHRNEAADVTVLLPLALRDHTGGDEAVAAAGSTVSAALTDVFTRHPALRRHLYTDAGALRGYVNVYLNRDEVRDLAAGMATALSPGDTLMIVPSIAGG